MSLALLQGQRFLKPPVPPRERRGHRWWPLVPVEELVKVIISLTGIISKFSSPGVKQPRMVDLGEPWRLFLFPNSRQPVTMYRFFLLSGVADRASHAGRGGI